jgi:hypothetical protein
MSVSGDLGYFGLAELLQILSISKNSGVIVVHGESEQGSLLLVGGRLVDARTTHGVVGEEAFFSLVGNVRGSFTFDREDPELKTARDSGGEAPGSIKRSLGTLLLEVGSHLHRRGPAGPAQ